MSCDGLSYRGTDLHTNTMRLEVVAGFAEPAEVRGADVTIPGAPGRTWMPKVADRRIIELQGYVRGMGADLETRQQSWRTTTDTLMALLDRTLAPGALVVTGPYLGLPDSESHSIDAVCINVIPGPVQASMTFQRWSIELEALDTDWLPGSS